MKINLEWNWNESSIPLKGDTKLKEIQNMMTIAPIPIFGAHITKPFGYARFSNYHQGQ